MKGVAYIDGKFHSIEEASISILDHGFLYGDNIFEGIRFFEKGIRLHERHKQRLLKSMVKLGINNEEVFQQYDTVLKQVIEKSGLTEGYIRLIVTRGIGDLGINPLKCSNSKLVVICTELSLFPFEAIEKGISATVSKIKKFPTDVIDGSIKSGNYLPNILATKDFLAHGYQEALMLTNEGYIAEATIANIFFAKGKQLYTPDLKSNCLPGITRKHIFELCNELGLPIVIETQIHIDQLLDFDEVFLTGTGAGVLPLTSIQGMSIGDNLIGPLTKLIYDKYWSTINSYCTKL